MSQGTLQAAAALMARVSLGCPPCWLVTGPEFLLQLNTGFQHILLLQIGTGIPFSVLSWALVSSQPVGKYQTVTYIKSCGYDGLSGLSSTQYQANSFPIIYVVLALDSWELLLPMTKTQQPNFLYSVFVPVAPLNVRLWDSLYCVTLWLGNLQNVEAPCFFFL